MPYRAEMTGPLPRPAYLAKARERLHAGEISELSYKRIEDRAVDEAIALQQESGLDVISDGEARRGAVAASVIAAACGLDGPRSPWRGNGRDARGNGNLIQTGPVRSASGKLRRVRSVASEEFTYLRARTGMPLKVALPSPLTLGSWCNPAISSHIYSDPFDAFTDAAQLLKEEIFDLTRLGCEYIQINAPEIVGMANPDVRARYEAFGISADRVASEGLGLLNELTQAASDVTLGIHLCQDTRDHGSCATDAYETIGERVFPVLAGYDVLLLEFGLRSGGFESLVHTLDHQTIVLGLVSSSSTGAQSEAEIRARVMAAAEYVPLGRLALSCQCGFDSTRDDGTLTPVVDREQLIMVSEVARQLWS
jgi:5-methyltetrahydropteroyltriglutamate--homocysteine methyltransferase